MNLTNQLLIATPDMPDERFEKAVILVCEHNENGALGINLNLASEVSFKDIMESLQIPQTTEPKEHAIYEGGPVNTQCGFILHQSGEVFDSSIQVSDNVFLSTSKDVIDAIAGNRISHKWLMALGCATWDADQLEEEIAAHAWLLAPADENLIFNHQQNKWDLALALMGIQSHQLSGDIGHA
ncbi:YqgE/AlgH family protein [Marinicella meishanensis]|uniref:YqgE/AlgH family protein n=1 Tax=Marinicella meishanensis TaxID=2873263 RepID=UPI001CBED096|nr:YqgE/AlgH family protein [Marinicella sp. NBU2979]